MTKTLFYYYHQTSGTQTVPSVVAHANNRHRNSKLVSRHPYDFDMSNNRRVINRMVGDATTLIEDILYPRSGTKIPLPCGAGIGMQQRICVPFQSIRSLGRHVIHDVYYDRSNILSSAGVWVRQRNGQWEAKVKRGGNFTNSRFEELSDPRAISQRIKSLTGFTYAEQDKFGLQRIATLSTTRNAWIADHEFKIVLDTMDFGHTVGEVELQQQTTFTARGTYSLNNKNRERWTRRTRGL